jgi:hypothetical protein
MKAKKRKTKQMKKTILLILLTLPLAAWAQPRLTVSSEAGNDLLRVLTEVGYDCVQAASPAEAVAQAPEGGAVLILAEAYPATATPVDAALFDAAAAKNLRVFIEYPAYLPGLTVGSRVTPSYDRAVVNSDFFGAELEPLRIVAIHGLNYLTVDAANAHMVSARVAGFDTAVFGLDGTATAPLLFELPDAPVLVASTKLSQFVTARYAPKDAWRTIWTRIMAWLLPGEELPELSWTSTVRPAYGRDEELPADFERQALLRGTEWFVKSKLIIHPDWERAVLDEIARDPLTPKLPTPAPDFPVGDGSLGMAEAPLAEINPDGSQPLRLMRRGDCHAEAAMALALGASQGAAPSNSAIAANLLDFYLFDSDARKGGRGDPNHGAYGLIAWAIDSPYWIVANYGDDNARLMLGAAATAAVLGEERWDEALMMCLLGNLRTTGQQGFRGSRIDMGALGSQGWQPFFERSIVSLLPHMESWLWACYLWAYERTGYEMFYQRAEDGLRQMMEAYPDGLRWMNGRAQERARLVLPLAWLLRVADTEEHREWLQTAVDGLLALQDESGAIREELGTAGLGNYPPPSSNSGYGTGEAPLIQQNGDPVSDLLYTVNFAFLGLHEAAAVTGDPEIKAAADKMAEFLCRIQVESDDHPSLDGGWFRAFDFSRWEAWGSNADKDWGAWVIESGWTQGWIVSVLALREMDSSLWELIDRPGIEAGFPEMRAQMLPDSVIDAALGAPIAHAGIGRPINVATPIDSRYPGKGAAGLLDGRLGTDSYQSSTWLGFEGVDLNATIDLGERFEIKRLGLNALQSIPVGIYLPQRVEFSVSDDGVNFTPAVTLEPQMSTTDTGPETETMLSDQLADVSARFVRMNAVSLGTIPAGNHSAGSQAWLFASEIVVDAQLSANIAVGADVVLDSAPSGSYPGTGAAGLVDGNTGFNEHDNGDWMGFEGSDMIATIDLGTSQAVGRITLGALQNVSIGIHSPARVEFSISDDGLNFETVATVANTLQSSSSGILRAAFSSDWIDRAARYIRVQAVNHGVIEDGLPGAGNGAWLFVDEITVADGSYKEWKASAFSDPADFADPLVSGPEAVAFADGMPNLIRYALGVPPPQSDARHLHPHLKQWGGGIGLALPSDPSVRGVSWGVEALSSLHSDWKDASVVFDSSEGATESDADGWRVVQVSDGDQDSMFYRLKMSF